MYLLNSLIFSNMIFSKVCCLFLNSYLLLKLFSIFSINGVHVYSNGTNVDMMKINITVKGNFSDKLQFRIYPKMFLGNASANGYLWKSSSPPVGKNYSYYIIVPLSSTYEFPSGISFRLEAYYGGYSAYYAIKYPYSSNSQSNSSLKSIFGSV
jgi:uncharacterized membrane protein